MDTQNTPTIKYRDEDEIQKINCLDKIVEVIKKTFLLLGIILDVIQINYHGLCGKEILQIENTKNKTKLTVVLTLKNCNLQEDINDIANLIIAALKKMEWESDEMAWIDVDSKLKYWLRGVKYFKEIRL